MHKQLDKGFVKVRYKYQKGGQFGQWLGNDVRAARVTVAPGIHQKGAYFDIQWWENGDYLPLVDRDVGSIDSVFSIPRKMNSWQNPQYHIHIPLIRC